MVCGCCLCQSYPGSVPHGYGHLVQSGRDLSTMARIRGISDFQPPHHRPQYLWPHDITNDAQDRIYHLYYVFFRGQHHDSCNCIPEELGQLRLRYIHEQHWMETERHCVYCGLDEPSVRLWRVNNFPPRAENLNESSEFRY